MPARSLALTYRHRHHLPARAHPWAQLVYARSGVLHVVAGERLWFFRPDATVAS
jgi:hypothetical protein